MRAFNVENGVEAERIVRAVAAELESHARENDGLKGAVLFIEVRRCIEEAKENGTMPQRKA